MSPEILTGLVLSLAGIIAGSVMAFVSHRLPELKLGPKPKRYLVLPVAGAAIGWGSTLWAAYQGSSVPLVAGFTALLGWQLLLLAIVDAENFWLPDILTFPLGLTGILASTLLPYPQGQGWMISLLSIAIGFSCLWLIAFVYRKVRGASGLGGGDPIFLGMGAAWVGAVQIPLVVIIASLSGLAVVLMLKLRGRDLGMTSKIPYGTFLALGFAVAWLST